MQPMENGERETRIYSEYGPSPEHTEYWMQYKFPYSRPVKIRGLSLILAHSIRQHNVYTPYKKYP